MVCINFGHAQIGLFQREPKNNGWFVKNYCTGLKVLKVCYHELGVYEVMISIFQIISALLCWKSRKKEQLKFLLPLTLHLGVLAIFHMWAKVLSDTFSISLSKK